MQYRRIDFTTRRNAV
ncbi:hypothetical protein D044_2434A, partial [Vibrio parahaemolyticus EKP-026]